MSEERWLKAEGQRPNSRNPTKFTTREREKGGEGSPRELVDGYLSIYVRVFLVFLCWSEQWIHFGDELSRGRKGKEERSG